jgi:hypothetical protein
MSTNVPIHGFCASSSMSRSSSGANDNSMYSEEPYDGKTVTFGSGVGVEPAMALPTITYALVPDKNCYQFQLILHDSIS